MSRATLVLSSATIREKAARWISTAPPMTRVEFKEPKRTLPQNARMWCMLTDIAAQSLWHGHQLSADDWKLLFLDALNREVRIVPNIDGDGFINLGRSSSDLSVSEMGDLITLMEAFGARHGVAFHDQTRRAA